MTARAQAPPRGAADGDFDRAPLAPAAPTHLCTGCKYNEGETERTWGRCSIHHSAAIKRCNQYSLGKPPYE